jgi:hypothetical protein
MGLNYLLSIPILFLAWALEYPLAALNLIRSLKRRTDLYIVRRTIQRSTDRLAKNFRARGVQEGYDLELIEKIFNENLPEITRRLERKMSGGYSR